MFVDLGHITPVGGVSLRKPEGNLLADYIIFQAIYQRSFNHHAFFTKSVGFVVHV